MASKVLDFTDVKDGGQYQPRHVPEGDYTARVTAVAEQKAKSDDEDMWVFTIVLDDRPSGKYPYYCKLTAEQLWKLRNLMIAGGVDVPKKRMKVDPNKLIGKAVGVAMVDDEYNGQMKSVVDAVFPVSDAEEGRPEDDDEEEVPRKGKSKSKKPDPVDEVDEDEDDEEDTPPPPKKGKRKPAPEPEPEDDDEEEEEDDEEEDEPEPPKKSKKAAAKAPAKKGKRKPPPPEDDEDDEDDDELDVDDDDL